jgi:uncharacterized membrane protein
MTFPLRLEYLDGWLALLLWLAAAVPIVLLGFKSLDALGNVRKWTAIAVRLLVLAVLVLTLGGARWERVNKRVDTVIVRDVSLSTEQVRLEGADDVARAVESWAAQAMDLDADKRGDDRVGIVSFDSRARIDLLPNEQLALGARALGDAAVGTDPAAGLNLALATLGTDAMHRIVLVWDGNSTTGDLDAAIEAAVAQGVPIDVMPLEYEVDNEVLVEDLIAPTSRRENEPFTIEVILRSTNVVDVTGSLTVGHQSGTLDLDPTTPGVQPTRRVTLRPGRNVERVLVPAMPEAGVHQFRAVFEPDGLASEITGDTFDPTRAAATSDTLLANNAASGFTFVKGKGAILFIDETVTEGAGERLATALAAEGIEVRRGGIEAFPPTLVELQRYDAVILANVRRGAGGLSQRQDAALASYVHDMGGGLLMIGGPDTFGAGGWQGSRTAEILPVELDVPAKRQLPKGALALIIHSTEMPQGNYWGEQCALKAVEILNARDEVAVLSYEWGGMGGGGVRFDYPLSPKGDGARVNGAIRNMPLGDMPDFDDALRKALYGDGNQPGLKASDAKQKHVIIISDGDASPPAPALVADYQAEQVSISTVTVYPHTPGQAMPQVMRDLADATGGRAYGPIENNPAQLPQIFIKEATVVRRSLIQEDRAGFPISSNPSPSDLVAGLGNLPPTLGYILTSRREDPQIEMPFTVGKEDDPYLAFWRTGLGKTAAFTGDTLRWSAPLAGSPQYNKFWAQLVRGVARPGESSDFDVRTVVEGGKGRLIIEAYDADNAFRNNLAFAGTVVGPDLEPIGVRPVQVAPGRYEAQFDAEAPGNYVVGLSFTGEGTDAGQLRGGTSVNGSPELRELRSDYGRIREVASRTGGRVLPAFEPQSAGLFARTWTGPDGGLLELRRTSSFTPIWDILIPLAIALVLLDVALRRIAWDWLSVQAAAANSAEAVRGYTLAGSRRGRDGEQPATLDALRGARQGTAARQEELVAAGRPDPGRKFEAGPGVEGDLTSVIGGATDAPLPKSRPNARPKADRERPGEAGASGGGMGSLMEAKRRAREKMQRERDS